MTTAERDFDRATREAEPLMRETIGGVVASLSDVRDGVYILTCDVHVRGGQVERVSINSLVNGVLGGDPFPLTTAYEMMQNRTIDALRAELETVSTTEPRRTIRELYQRLAASQLT